MARKPTKNIRVRSKRLDQIDETKLALAVWLMAKGIVEDRTTNPGDEATTGDPSDRGPAKQGVV